MATSLRSSQRQLGSRRSSYLLLELDQRIDFTCDDARGGMQTTTRDEARVYRR